jgi:hypothetical protein
MLDVGDELEELLELLEELEELEELLDDEPDDMLEELEDVPDEVDGMVVEVLLPPQAVRALAARAAPTMTRACANFMARLP